MPRSPIVERLKELRLTAGVSQTELARRIGVVVGTIGNYEAGTREPSFEICEKWATALGRSIHVVVADVDQEAAQMVPTRDRRLLSDVRSLPEDDRVLVEMLARGLRGGDRRMREMIAVQIPLLLESAPSDVGPSKSVATIT